MCFPTIESGTVEVEERRPRYRNEPHRKRLKFVKDRSTRLSDEWALTRLFSPERGYQEPLRQPPHFNGGQQQHFNGGQPQHFNGGQPQHFNGGQPPHFNGGQPPHFNGGQPPHFNGGQPPHFNGGQPYNNYGHGFERPEVFRPGNQNPPQELEPPRRHSNEPRLLETEPHHQEFTPRSQLPHNLQVNAAPGRSRRGRSRPRSRSRAPHGQYQDHPVYSDDTFDESSRGSNRSRPRQSRRPRSSWGADSYDSFDMPPRQHRRSRSGRRP